MRRALVAVVTVGTACAVLLTGCGGTHARSGRAGTTNVTPASGAPAPSGGASTAAATAPDATVDTVSSLLDQVDNQLDADGRASRDSD